jgi:hypothetical protein
MRHTVVFPNVGVSTELKILRCGITKHNGTPHIHVFPCCRSNRAITQNRVTNWQTPKFQKRPHQLRTLKTKFKIVMSNQEKLISLQLSLKLFKESV